MKASFREQLLNFKKDASFKDKYKDVEIKGSNYLIEIFRFVDNQGDEGDIRINSNSPILVHDIYGNLRSAAEAIYTKFTHVAKVVRVNDTSSQNQYSEGDIVLLNPKEACGTVWNPDFLFLKQHSEANYEPILPEGMPEKIGAIQGKFEDFFFLLPEQFEDEAHMITTFLVPEHKIKAKYNI
jgi:hypothetical protein